MISATASHNHTNHCKCKFSTNTQPVHSSSPIVIVSTDQNSPTTGQSNTELCMHNVSPTVTTNTVDVDHCGSAVIGEFNNNKLMTQ